MKFLGTTPLHPMSMYVHELRKELPPEAFEPARSRLIAMPIALAIIGVSIAAIANRWVPWPMVPLLSLVIGACFAVITFVAHEAMHGGIVRGRRLKHVISWIGFLPFTLSPTLWAAWHDRAHHATANIIEDPDMYPTLDYYKTHAGARFAVDVFSLGGRRWRGGLSLILGFTVQSATQLVGSTHRTQMGPTRARRAIAETVLGIGVWATVAVLVGFVPFLFVFVLPLLVANVAVMMFILTNHSLSPQVEINDPLVSGLSVTTPRWLEILSLGFGYHVEHHVFPAMSTRHAPLVRDLLQRKWPERYQSMPLSAALRLLHTTARVYKDAMTLIDPTTGREYPTLMPGATSASLQQPACASKAPLLLQHAR
jgi:fatty acid desaturase